MATVISTLSVKMGLDATDFNRSIEAVGRKLEETGRSIRDIGSTLTTRVTAPIVAGFGAAVWAASDLNETINKTNVVFGDAADGVMAWSEDSATAFGLSQNEALGFASTFGNIFTGMGMTGDAAAELSTNFVQLGADLGSFNNVPTAEALDAIRAGVMGEYEPLRRFGIVLTEAEVNAKALEMGLVDANGEVTEAGKVAARTALIQEKSANAQGDFANTSGSLANQMKILRARLTNAAAAIGQILLPYVTQAVGWIAKMAERFQGLGEGSQKIIVVIGLIAAAIGPLLMVFGTLATGIGKVLSMASKIKTFFTVIRTAMMTSLGPILIVIAVLALLYIVWTKDLFGIKTKITAWFNAFKQSKTFEKLKETFQAVKKAVLDFAVKAIGKAVELFKQFIAAIKGPATQAFNGFKSILSTVVGFVGMVIGGIIARLDPLKSAFYGIVDMIKGFVNLVKALLDGDLRGALDAVKDIFMGWLQYITGLGGFLLSALSGVFGYVWDALSSVDWAGVGAALLGYIQSAIDGLIDLGGKMATKAQEMIAGFVDWFSNYDWAGLGTTILGYIDTAAAAITGLATKLGAKASEWWSGFVNWFTNYDWAGLGTTILGYIETAASYIFLPLVLYEHGGKLIDGLLTGIDAAWVFVSKWFGNIGTKVLTAIGDLIDTLVDKGSDLLSGMLNGITGFWENSLKPWFSNLLSQIYTVLSYIFFPLVLYEHGADLLEGFLNGIESAWLFVKRFFGTIKTAITTYFSKALEWLVDKGKDIFTGLKSGLETMWNGVTGVGAYIGGIPGKITAVFSGAISWLTQTGKDVFAGLWNGLWEYWTYTLKPWIDDKINYIKSIPGISWLTGSPSRLYMQYGYDLMDGLQIGLEKGEMGVMRTLGSTIGDIAGATFTAPTVAAVNAQNGMNGGTITINVSGAGDPMAVAEAVYSRFSRELGLRGAL